MSVLFAVDVGGTFTDIVTLDEATGMVSIAKAPTTPEDPSKGVAEAIRKVETDIGEASLFFHGTTLGVNTVLERKGACTGLLTTKGFRDELEIARMTWPMYRLHWSRPEPLVPRFLRRELTERISASGQVLQPLDSSEVRNIVTELLDEGVESIAICLLHAYAFPDHELQAIAVIETEFPGLAYTASHMISQEYREYERAVTTVVDAMIKPVMSRYLSALDGEMTKAHFDGNLLITRCDGGVMSVAEAKDRSVRTLVSGPASGVMGSAAIAKSLGVTNILSIDMGGTSFDCALVVDCEPAIQAVARVGDLPLLMPSVELATIGAGGGSIASVDAGGMLEVGPESAGASPGPMCYGKGGLEPTFTDAALVSGLIDPHYFLGGEIALDAEAARHGILEKIARPLGLAVEEAASGIVGLTEAKMAATVESITIGKGHDPRAFALLAYGGGGPLAASAIAHALQIPRTIIPPSPATFSAWGMLSLDIVHDFSRTLLARLDELDVEAVAAAFETLEAEAGVVLDRERIPSETRRMTRAIDVRYENQEHAISVPVSGTLDAASWARVRPDFERLHEVAYGYRVEDPVQVVTYRVRATGLLEAGDRVGSPGQRLEEPALKGVRRVTHRASGGELEFRIYERGRLDPTVSIDGPAIIEEPTSTTFVGPRDHCVVDSRGNLILTHDVDLATARGAK